MKFKELLRQFIKSINPSKYHHVSENQMNHSFELFFLIFFLSFVVMAVLFIPVISSYSHTLHDAIADLDEAHVNVSIKSNEPVVLLHSPQVVIDSNATGIGSANLVFADEKYYYSLFGEHNGTYTFQSDLKDSNDFLIDVLLALLMPGVLLFFGAGFLFLLLLFLLFVSFITFFFVKNNLTFRDVLVIALHASLFPLALFLLGLPFVNFLLLSFVLFFFIFILGLLQANKHRSKIQSRIHSSDSDYGAFENRTTLVKRKTSKRKKHNSSKKSKKPRQVEIWD